jgi:hypothetical protein
LDDLTNPLSTFFEENKSTDAPVIKPESALGIIKEVF